MKSVKASKQGLVRIRAAISAKEWNRSDDRWSLAASKILKPSTNWEKLECFAYGCSKTTRDRLLGGDPILEKTFKAFCQALELNPYEIAEDLEPASDEQNLEVRQQELQGLRKSQWQIMLHGCRLIDLDPLLPEAQKLVRKLLDTLNRLISIEKNELTQKLLPKKFKVYVKDNSVISHPKDEWKERILPTVNLYEGNDGGYVAFYSSNPDIGVYSVGDGIYVIGQIRLQGKYNGRIFVPKGCEGKDLNTVQWIKDLGKRHFKSEDDIGVGGDTGGWFDFPTLIG